MYAQLGAELTSDCGNYEVSVRVKCMDLPIHVVSTKKSCLL